MLDQEKYPFDHYTNNLANTISANGRYGRDAAVNVCEAISMAVRISKQELDICEFCNIVEIAGMILEEQNNLKQQDDEEYKKKLANVEEGE